MTESNYQAMNYFKRERSFKNILSEEFAFSMLYNNIAPDKLDDALRSVGFTHMPSFFLLIQVDDYSNESKRLSIENEFVLKVKIVDIVRACLTGSGIEHSAANLTGTDKLVAFLVMDEDAARDERLMRISEDISEKVHYFTGYSVSICISDLCRDLPQFSKNYERASKILQESFYLGKRIQTKTASAAEVIRAEPVADETDRCAQSVYLALSKGDRILFGQTMVSFFDSLQKNGRSREQVQLLAGKLLDRMGEYVLSCGVEEEKQISRLIARCKEAVLTCRYADDICLILMECYETLCAMLERLRGRSAEDSFRETVRQYIRDHFKERIYLDEIAAGCGYSKYYFCRQMKKCFGEGLSDCVNRYRVERAKLLLRSGRQTIEEIVHEVGFSSANYFEIVFRKSTGVSPSTYRKMADD